MRKPPPFEERLEAKREALQRAKARISSIQSKPPVKKLSHKNPEPPKAAEDTSSNIDGANRTVDAPKRIQTVFAGTFGLTFSDRIDTAASQSPQPWITNLTNTALRVASEGGAALCLVWPARLDSVVPLHALTTLEKTTGKELLGLRTVLFPGHHGSRSALNAWLVNRKQLANVYRSLWETSDKGSRPISAIESKSMRAVLAALNSIELEKPEILDPALGEIIPSFIFDPDLGSWQPTIKVPLERTLRKVPNLRYRTDLRKEIGTEWVDLSTAPGALLIVHNGARKDHWKAALRRCAKDAAMPELFLYDATSAADQSNFRAVRRIPDFLVAARDNGCTDTGSLVVTDDPRTFVVLRARLSELHIPFSAHVFPAEADQTLFSKTPFPLSWTPPQKSNALLSVSVVDRDASSVALSFCRLAPDAERDSSHGYEQLMEGCRYILRLSNLPAGYRDLTDAMSDGYLDEYSSNKNSWATVERAMRVSAATGCYGDKLPAVEKAIEKARTLIDSWTDGTPMALKLQAVIKKRAIDSRESLVVVLPNRRYVALAHRFLARTLADRWAAIESRIEWHTLSTVAKNLSADSGRRHFVFAGVNRNVLRILLSHPEIPNGTSIFISYRQAESTLKTVRAMKELSELKAYRGRIGLLIPELERRLGEVPKLPNIERIGDLSLTFSFDEKASVDSTTEHNYFRFDLDGGNRAFHSGWVFKYEPDEDPVFRKVPAAQIAVGDFIFDMSDSLRGKVEAALQINSEGLNTALYPERALLRLYHQDVQRRTAGLFNASTRADLARQIHAKMIELDSTSKDCRIERIHYWLDLEENETIPHASKDPKFFKLFCRALSLSDDDALRYWNFVNVARRLNQNLGRALAAQYAEIIFQPESAIAYRSIPAQLVQQLQQDALLCVHRVERVEAPAGKK